MTWFDRGLAFLIAIGLIGIIVLTGMDKSVDELVVITSSLIGIGAGKQIPKAT